MSDYTKTVDFAAKDALASGNPAKAAKGTEVDTEFDNIATAIATKYDINDRDVASGICPLDAGGLVPAANLPAATEVAIGALEIATSAEATALTDDDKIITPLKSVDTFEANITNGDTVTGLLDDFYRYADPGVDVLWGWDDSAGIFNNFAVGLGLTSTASPAIELSHLGIEDLTDPGGDRLLGWDDTAGNSIWFNAADGLSFDNGASTFGLADAAATSTRAIDISSGVVNVDISSLTTMDATTIAGADLFLIDDGAGGTNKSIAWQDWGIPMTDDTTTTPLSGVGLSDANRWYNCDNASAITATIPANSSVAFPVGTVFAFHQQGAGAVTVVVTTDTLRQPFGDATAAQYSTIFATKTGTTEWTITGQSA